MAATNTPAQFSVEASGSAPMALQWFRNGTSIEGANGSTLTISNVQTSDEALYSVDVVNCAGSVSSWGAYLILHALIVDLPDPGTVVNFSGALLPDGLTNIIAISAGAVHALALRQDETVTAWGNEAAAALGVTNTPASLNSVIAVCAGDDFSLALLRSGQVMGWGNGACANVPEYVHDIKALSAGARRCLALKNDGTVVEWGSPTTLHATVANAAAIAVAGDYSLITRRDGRIELYGSPARTLSNVPTNSILAAGDTSCYALISNATVISLTTEQPQPPPNLRNVRSLSARNGRYLALHIDGSVTGWGNVEVPSRLTNVSAVAAGGLYCLGLMRHPPAPTLSVRLGENSRVHLTAPFAVSGYRLEEDSGLSGFQPANLSFGVHSFGNISDPALVLDATNSSKFYRLHR
jgi:hypothetical protein